MSTLAVYERGTVAEPACVLLSTFSQIARELLGDRARPLTDEDRDAAEELLDRVELSDIVRWLSSYFRCADAAIQQRNHSFIWFCGFVLVMEEQ
jgi:hypothetical protein